MNVKNYFINAYGTRLLILGLDLLLSLFSFLAAVTLRFNFEVPDHVIAKFLPTLAIVGLVRIVTYKAFRTYSGIIRFTSEKDLLRVVLASLVGSAGLLMLGTVASFWFISKSAPFFFSNSVLLIDLLLITFTTVALRVVMRSINLYVRKERGDLPKAPVILFGAGQCGFITKNTLEADPESRMQVVAFFDDNPYVHRKNIQGTRIYAIEPEVFAKVVERYKVKKAVISIQKISQGRKKELADLCLEYNVTPMMVPPVDSWLNNRLHVRDIKKLNIEDLLQRPLISLDKVNINRELHSKTVMVTGAAGSIGSELARQIATFAPKRLILLDAAESPLVEIEREIAAVLSKEQLSPLVADIRDYDYLNAIMEEFRPDVVFHAAAYKHVPAMERQPHQAIKVNVLGTKNMADLSVRYGTQKFVMVSTDKAVNPTNVMGASKRIAEIYIQALNNHLDNTSTKFITTRFGNVLGSNGSVVPLFRKQIEVGGPITVTHPDITRFFMTIPEACQLVLEAGAMGKGGEIFLFDMGKAVRVLDLAEKMVKLYGLQPYKDIAIQFTGLRPGEKLNEELLSEQEGNLPTYHKKIMIAQVRKQDFTKVEHHTAWLAHLADNQNDLELVEAMKGIVPEFVSNCSKYEKLDKVR